MKTYWSLKSKLICTFLAIGMAPLFVTMALSYLSTSSEIETQANSRIDGLVGDRAHQIEAYFNAEFKGITTLASSAMLRSAVVDFEKAFDSYKAMTPTPEERARVEEFYNRTYSAEYIKNNPGESFDSRSYLAEFDNAALNAQYDFIANNEHPVGAKNKLYAAKRPVSYNTPHGVFHPELADYLQKHDLYDLFLVSASGRVVYSVFKETDFAANLTRGLLANSGLGRAFSQSLKLNPGEVYVEDFARYGPSYESPASFAATPIFANGKLIGTIIIQLPLNKIAEIVANREGLGVLGQVLLFGEDGRLRADAYRQKETYNIANIFKKNSTIKMSSPMIEAAVNGKTGNAEENSYDGTKVIASYRPIKIANLKWTILSELGESELHAGINQLKLFFVFMLAIAASLIAGSAWIMSKGISSNLQKIIGSLSESSKHVSTASTEADASATTLSEAATEQAASLQETMASAEEISAMISQNAESAAKAKVTVEANDQATKDGAAAVIDMVSAIGEIKTTNEQILQQMQASNKEFAEIVAIISEIGEKTKVINDIVFQTKLLSFNASVEAARAGEHGKGFAVVAEEVGNLAQMSGNAAKEITDMLSASIKRVNLIVEQTKTKVEQLVEIGKDKVTMGQSTADRCRLSLNKLAQNAATLTSMVTEIAHASKEQAQGVKEINAAISQLDQVTQQNSAVAQHSSAQAETLLKETKSLNDAVTQLATFVQGGSVGEALVHIHQKAEAVTVAPDRSRPKAQVVSISSFKKKTEQAKTQADSVAHENKLAAGSEMTPANNHRQFEDF